MPLQPNDPPGHASRKLRGHLQEIERLRGEGYTIRAIHEALTSAGIQVSWASVQREVARASRSARSASRKPEAPAASSRPTTLSSHAVGDSLERSGSVDLHQFFDEHNANPLFKRRPT